MPKKSLSDARSKNLDEFYTLYKDVKKELDHYVDQFRDKIIYCPCDTENSSFVRYFCELRDRGIIKELIYTSIQNGVSFNSEEAFEDYKRCDIIVTNPPFSLFRLFIDTIISTNKLFIVWGTSNAISYKNVIGLLKKGTARVGFTFNATPIFEVPEEYSGLRKVFRERGKLYCRVTGVSVYTNMEVHKPKAYFPRKYSTRYYKKYDNFDAINVDKTDDIPGDFEGIMGVPITYLSKHDGVTYEIIGIFNNFDPDPENGLFSGERVSTTSIKTRGPVVEGNALYARLLIKKRDV